MYLEAVFRGCHGAALMGNPQHRAIALLAVLGAIGKFQNSGVPFHSEELLTLFWGFQPAALHCSALAPTECFWGKECDFRLQPVRGVAAEPHYLHIPLVRGDSFPPERAALVLPLHRDAAGEHIQPSQILPRLPLRLGNFQPEGVMRVQGPYRVDAGLLLFPPRGKVFICQSGFVSQITSLFKFSLPQQFSQLGQNTCKIWRFRGFGPLRLKEQLVGKGKPLLVRLTHHTDALPSIASG